MRKSGFVHKKEDGVHFDTPSLSPFELQLSFLELATFQVALHHSLVEFLAEFIKEIGAAVILATLHVHIDVVTVL